MTIKPTVDNDGRLWIKSDFLLTTWGYIFKAILGIDFTCSCYSHLFGDENITSSSEIGSTINVKIVGLNLPEDDRAQIVSNLYISAGLK